MTIMALGMAPPERDPSSMQRYRILSEEVSASNPSRAAIKHCDTHNTYIDIDMTIDTASRFVQVRLLSYLLCFIQKLSDIFWHRDLDLQIDRNRLLVTLTCRNRNSRDMQDKAIPKFGLYR